MTLAPPSAVEARAALAAEWNRHAPQSASDIAEFYRTAQCMGDDLEAFHRDPERQQWTALLVNLASQYLTEADGVYIDIGSGLGHDLKAVREAVPVATIYGVEPNEELNRSTGGFDIFPDVDDAPIEQADLLSCFDVLEHIPSPEAWLGGIASRCKAGAVLVETCATFDLDTPLHLKENAGWHPGRVLETNGFVRLNQIGRMRFWQKLPERELHTGLLLCAYRGLSTDTFLSILNLLDQPHNKAKYGWRVSTTGEAGINRSRSVLTSRWLREMADDVFLMIDDDIIFQPEYAERIVDLCRNGHDVICAAYPVRDGSHLAIQGFSKEDRWEFGDGAEPVEIRWGSTGFFAVHRRVFEAMIPTLPLCHPTALYSFWPFFDFSIHHDPELGAIYLSEDWTFCQRASELGFKIWLDQSILLGHLGTVPLHVGNMQRIHEAIKR